MRKIENTPTTLGDLPKSPCVITTSGQLSSDDPSLSAERLAYEDYSNVEENLELENPEIAFKVACGRIKMLSTF